MNKYITTNYQCTKCQKQYEFSENSNTSGLRQYKCNHFFLKFIKSSRYNSFQLYRFSFLIHRYSNQYFLAFLIFLSVFLI